MGPNGRLPPHPNEGDAMKWVRWFTFGYLTALTVFEGGLAIWGAVRHRESDVMTCGGIMLMSGIGALMYWRWMRK